MSYAFHQCKNFENRSRFDKATVSSMVGTFLTHSVWYCMILYDIDTAVIQILCLLDVPPRPTVCLLVKLGTCCNQSNHLWTFSLYLWTLVAISKSTGTSLHSTAFLHVVRYNYSCLIVSARYAFVFVISRQMKLHGQKRYLE